MEHQFDINEALHFIGNTKVRQNFKKKELKEYYRWFMANIDNNIAQLKERINAMKGGENWVPDFTLDSIKKLNDILQENITGHLYDNPGTSFRGEVHARYLTIDGVYVGASHDELILIYQIAVYLGETIIHMYPTADLKWDLCGNPRKYTESGQITLYVSDFNDINFINIVMWTVYGLISEKHGLKKGPTPNLYEWFLRRTRLLRENSDPRCMPQPMAKLSPNQHLYDPRVYGHYKYLKEIYAEMRGGYNYYELGPRKKNDTDTPAL